MKASRCLRENVVRVEEVKERREEIRKILSVEKKRETRIGRVSPRASASLKLSEEVGKGKGGGTCHSR